MGPYADRSLIPFSDLDVNVADRRIKCPWSSVRRGCRNWCSAGPSILLHRFRAGACEEHHIGGPLLEARRLRTQIENRTSSSISNQPDSGPDVDRFCYTIAAGGDEKNALVGRLL